MGRPRTIRGAALGVACLAAVTSACGSGGSKGVSKAEYLGQASRICREGNEALTAASEQAFATVPPGQKLSQPQIEDFVRRAVVPTIRDQIRRLRDLPPPQGRKKQAEEIYNALDSGLGELERNPGKLTDGSNVFAEAEAVAKKYGLSVCATTG